jgi:hypothetical protein
MAGLQNMGGQGSLDEAKAGRRLVSRRAVNIGAAWSVPVILTAVAAPTASASPNTADDGNHATLGTATGEKGEDSNGNRRVTFYLSFVDIQGTNTVLLTFVSGGFNWQTLPAGPVYVTVENPTASFVVTRPGTDNSATTLDVKYKVNGVEHTEYGVVIKNSVRG